MGQNHSYNKELDCVPEDRRSHIDSGYRIAGHKVVITKNNIEQKKNILNSNSTNAIYLIAKVDKKNKIVIHNINIFKGHELWMEINLEYDPNGNILPFNKEGGRGSHAHIWPSVDNNSSLGRREHDKKNTFEIPSEYKNIVKLIEQFNKEGHIFDKDNINKKE